MTQVFVYISIAGHGGRGGMSKTGYLTSRESVAYGSTTKPDTAGSGGGGGGGEQGGRGGGVLHLVIGKELRVYGVVSADGTAATGSASGGGSGGSIYISTDVFTGNGTVSTNGGEASSGGGGGGGGRVTIFVTENAFTGQLQSFGGKIEQGIKLTHVRMATAHCLLIYQWVFSVTDNIFLCPMSIHNDK